MGEWAPLPPHEIRSTLSGGCLKSLGGVSGFGGAGGVRLFLCLKLNRKVLELFARIGFLLLYLSLCVSNTLRGAFMFSRALMCCA